MLSGRGTAGAGLRRMGVGCGEVDEAVVMVWRIVGRGISSWRIRREGGGVNEGLEDAVFACGGLWDVDVSDGSLFSECLQ